MNQNLCTVKGCTSCNPSHNLPDECCKKCADVATCGNVFCPCHNPPLDVKEEGWSDEEYILNLKYVLPDIIEHQWRLLFGLVQGKINHEIQAALEKQAREIEQFIRGHSEKVTQRLWYVNEECLADIPRFFDTQKYLLSNQEKK